MAYNLQINKKRLSEIKFDTFREAIYLCYKKGMTSSAPLGWSGDSILIFGSAGNEGRKSVVSVRNYCGDAELLITDTKGHFLFYGRFNVNLGLDFVVEQYWTIFNLVKHNIETEIKNISKFHNVQISGSVSNC